MSKLACTTAIVVGLSSLGTAAEAADRQGAEATAISSATLAQLGLGDLQPLSERQGMEVRGRSVIEGNAGRGIFTTAPNVLKPLLGVVNHTGLKGGGRITTIVQHPQHGTVILPPSLKK